jgi:hypothetical protein
VGGKERVVPAFNRERVSEEFRQLADLADAAFRANLRNISADPAAVRMHDELLARACVFGYLYDRHFLHSPELLLNELRWLRAMRRPEAPSHCIHPSRFEAHRDAQLDMLVQRFQGGLDYRDSLDAHDAPTVETRGVEERPGVEAALRQTSKEKSRSD